MSSNASDCGRVFDYQSGGFAVLRMSLRKAVVLAGLAFFALMASGYGASGYLKPEVSARVLERAESHFRDGVELYQERNYRGALRRFLAAERACPELFSAGYHVALVHRKMGNEGDAVTQLKKLNAAFAENIIAHNDLGVVYAARNDEKHVALAVAEFETAIRNGESLLLGKEKKIRQVRVDLAMAYANLGALQFKNSRFADAERSFRKAAQHYPRGFFGHFGLGNALFAMNRLGEAKDAYRKAQEIEPNNVNVRIALAKCYLLEREKNPRFAIAELKKIKMDNPPSEVFELLGDAYALLGNREEAIRNYKLHLALPGRNVEVLYKLGAIHYNERDFDQAEKYLQEFVAEASKGGGGAISVAYKLLGDIARGKDDYEEAIANYREGAKLRENYFSCYYGLAEACFHLQRYEEAKEYLRLVLDGLPQKGSAEVDELREKSSELLKKITSEK